MAVIAVLTTVDSREQADTIARAMISRGLAACVQISAIDSVYRWEGEVHEDPEFRLLIKTTDQRYSQVEAAIRELHTYNLPAIMAFPMTHAYPPFADWVAGQTGAATS